MKAVRFLDMTSVTRTERLYSKKKKQIGAKSANAVESLRECSRVELCSVYD